MPNQVMDRDTKTVVNKKHCPKYKVILHNDEVNDVFHVQKALRQVVGLSEQAAHKVMYTAHTQGKALVITCVLEMAEFYKEQLELKNLTVSLEKE